MLSPNRLQWSLNIPVSKDGGSSFLSEVTHGWFRKMYLNVSVNLEINCLEI